MLKTDIQNLLHKNGIRNDDLAADIEKLLLSLADNRDFIKTINKALDKEAKMDSFGRGIR